MKPIIGITCLHDWKAEIMRQNDTYVNAVSKAGGAPVLLPSVNDSTIIDAMLVGIDGLLISGGPDLGASTFEEEPHKDLGGVSPLMDDFEIEIINKAINLGIPILGICRGVQSLNVACGGTLYQDIYAQCTGNLIQHRQLAPRAYTCHSAKLITGSLLANLLGEEIRVNSFHHQAIKDVAPGFDIVGVAPDGIIEAIESKDKDSFIVGVQWHPEGMWNSAYNYDALFNAFISKATK